MVADPGDLKSRVAEGESNPRVADPIGLKVMGSKCSESDANPTTSIEGELEPPAATRALEIASTEIVGEAVPTPANSARPPAPTLIDGELEAAP